MVSGTFYDLKGFWLKTLIIFLFIRKVKNEMEAMYG